MRALRRFFAVLLLLAWVTPGAGAMAVGLHLALDHHHGPDEHGAALADLAEAATHGHRHDAMTTGEHGHEYLVDARPPALDSGASRFASISRPAVPELTPGESPRQEHVPRRASPTPLFTTLCSLLI